jgi:hypothetical protein
MNPRDTSGCRQNPSPITKSRRLEESKSRSPFFRSLLGLIHPPMGFLFVNLSKLLSSWLFRCWLMFL